MNNIDFDPNMFNKDAYGNLTRKTNFPCPDCDEELFHDGDGFFCEECGWSEKDVV